MTATMPKTVPLFGSPQGWQTELYRKRFVFHLIVSKQDHFRRDFMDWMVLNYAIWIGFEAEADRIWSRGFRRWSGRTIGEYLRHETALREGPNEHGWKLNNNILPDLSRLYMMMHPDRADFFETRVNPLSVRSQ